MRSIDDIPPPSALRDPAPASERAEKYGEPMHAVIAKIRSGIIAGAHEDGQWYVKNAVGSQPKAGWLDASPPQETHEDQEDGQSSPHLPPATTAQRVVTFVSMLLLFLMFVTGGRDALGDWFAEKMTHWGIPLWGFMAGGTAVMAMLLYIDRHDLRAWHQLPGTLKFHYGTTVFGLIVFFLLFLLALATQLNGA